MIIIPEDNTEAVTEDPFKEGKRLLQRKSWDNPAHSLVESILRGERRSQPAGRGHPPLHQIRHARLR